MEWLGRSVHVHKCYSNAFNVFWSALLLPTCGRAKCGHGHYQFCFESGGYYHGRDSYGLGCGGCRPCNSNIKYVEPNHSYCIPYVPTFCTHTHDPPPPFQNDGERVCVGGSEVTPHHHHVVHCIWISIHCHLM